jgi:hypothetical protein
MFALDVVVGAAYRIRIAKLARKNLCNNTYTERAGAIIGVGDEAAMHGGREFDSEFDRPVIRNSGELQLGHSECSQLL